MTAKYELINQTTINCVPMYQIRALRDLPGVKAGQLGGYVESEDNLSHEGECWIDESSIVRGNARVSDNARVISSIIEHNACVYGHAKVVDARINYDAQVYGQAIVEWSCVTDDARVRGNAQIDCNTRIAGNARIGGNASIGNNRAINTGYYS